jgi:hypothetical protein
MLLGAAKTRGKSTRRRASVSSCTWKTKKESLADIRLTEISDIQKCQNTSILAAGNHITVQNKSALLFSEQNEGAQPAANITMLLQLKGEQAQSPCREYRTRSLRTKGSSMHLHYQGTRQIRKEMHPERDNRLRESHHEFNPIARTRAPCSITACDVLRTTSDGGRWLKQAQYTIHIRRRTHFSYRYIGICGNPYDKTRVLPRNKQYENAVKRTSTWDFPFPPPQSHLKGVIGNWLGGPNN